MKIEIFKYPRSKVQNIGLLMMIGTFLFIGLYSFKYFFLMLFYSYELSTLDFSYHLIYLIIALILLFFYLKKSGIILIQGKLYKSKFLFGKSFNLKPVDIELFKDIDVLKFHFKRADPESGYQMETDKSVAEYKVYLLSSNHSKRELICSTFNKEEALKIKAFLVDELGVKPNKYNPPSSRRRKRR